jgi:hypothetical protein
VEVSVFQFRPSSVSQNLTNIKVRPLDRIPQQRDKITGIPDIEVPRETEILQIKPSLYGVSIDQKALWRRAFRPKK